jgi:phage tail sheath protein FI
VTNEVHRNVSLDPNHPRYFVPVTNAASTLVALTTGSISGSPADFVVENPLSSTDPTLQPDPADFVELAGGTDASPPSTVAQVTAFGTSLIAGMNTLKKIEPAVVNLVCVPALPAANLQAAIDFCEDSYAFLIVDPPEDATTKESAVALLGGAVPASTNAALYWPRVTVSDPAAEGRPRNIGPSGAIAGAIARTDATRGVWKAPAGIEATLGGVQLAVPVTDADSQVLNPVGINVLRTMPVIGNVVWGARTLFGADVRGSEWKYIPVRRTALFIEQSLNAGLKWVVFEPNDEPLWSQIRLNVGSFMQDLFRRGAFQGTTPRDAYFVRCDKNTTTQSDIDKGIVNILVGFAPLKPAEFVVIQIQQMAGQANA